VDQLQIYAGQVAHISVPFIHHVGCTGSIVCLCSLPLSLSLSLIYSPTPRTPPPTHTLPPSQSLTHTDTHTTKQNTQHHPLILCHTVTLSDSGIANCRSFDYRHPLICHRGSGIANCRSRDDRHPRPPRAGGRGRAPRPPPRPRPPAARGGRPSGGRGGRSSREPQYAIPEPRWQIRGGR
jgi:hypothetical protein